MEFALRIYMVASQTNHFSYKRIIVRIYITAIILHKKKTTPVLLEDIKHRR